MYPSLPALSKEDLKDYLCNCIDMKWMQDNNKVFEYENGHWFLAWIELDKYNNGTNIERFGVKFNYCLFCGKKIKG
jgi:hypothetical protein